MTLFLTKRCAKFQLISVKKHYKPDEKLQEMRSSNDLDPLQSKALQFAELLKETAGIPWNALGISGSIMVGLHTPESDIDPVVYGSENCKKVYSALRSMFKNKHESVKPYTQQDTESVVRFPFERHCNRLRRLPTN